MDTWSLSLVYTPSPAFHSTNVSNATPTRRLKAFLSNNASGCTWQIGSFAGNLIASGFFLRLLDAAGGFVTFFLFGSVVFVSTAYIYGVVPETRNKEPESILSEIPSCGNCLWYTELASEATNASDEEPETESKRPDGGTDKWL